jgi:hypothetical protein
MSALTPDLRFALRTMAKTLMKSLPVDRPEQLVQSAILASSPASCSVDFLTVRLPALDEHSLGVLAGTAENE